MNPIKKGFYNRNNDNNSHINKFKNNNNDYNSYKN